MTRTWLPRIAAGCVLVLLVRGTVLAADDKTDDAKDVKKVQFVPRNFYSKYLAPRVDSRLQGDATAAREYANPAANPWTRDPETVRRVQEDAIRAGKNAVKQYLVDVMRVDTWAIPLFETHGAKAGVAATDTGLSPGDTRARLRFGISHLTPRAVLTIPATYGRVALSADGRGAVGAAFESHSYTFRVGVDYDPQQHTGTFTLGGRF